MAKKKRPTTASNASPGPWKLIPGDKDRREMSRIVKEVDPDFLIGYALCEALNDLQRAEDLANGQLMAAAPDLLLACQAILAWADRECMPQGGKNDGPWEAVEAAVAKAAAAAK